MSTEKFCQGMANYAKINPAAFSTGVRGLEAPYVLDGVHGYLEFVCPNKFNETAYKRDDAMMSKYPINPQDAR
jgi:hypothetical protein